MNHPLIGRKDELRILNDAYQSARSELIVIYGRRRIGKSRLVAEFSMKKNHILKFEGIEGSNTKEQIGHFKDQLNLQLPDPFLEDMNFANWSKVLHYVTEKWIIGARIKKKKILFLDEIQWMAAGKCKLISLLKYYWDNHWKAQNVMFILCGSIASFMIKKVIQSKALYGRITCEMHLKGLNPGEAALFFKGKKNKEEILKYLLLFGGVPKYLEDIAPSRSFNQNINNMCFHPHAVMVKEIDRIFYNQFKESTIYRKITGLLAQGLWTLNDISRKLNITSGGGLKQYLDNLERAEIIRSEIPFDKKSTTKFKKYRLADEYLLFYFKYMFPNIRSIEQGERSKLFETLAGKSIDTWLGFAFERFCTKHSMYMAEVMGFKDEALYASPHFGRADQSFQIDLLYKRADNIITLCEVKYHNQEISTKVIPEVERKRLLLKIPRSFTLNKALISLYGPDIHLKDSGYFDYSITLEDMFCD